MSLNPAIFDLSSKAKDIRERLTAFMATHIYPSERIYHEQGNAADRWQPRPIVEELKAYASENQVSLFTPEK